MWLVGGILAVLRVMRALAASDDDSDSDSDVSSPVSGGGGGAEMGKDDCNDSHVHALERVVHGDSTGALEVFLEPHVAALGDDPWYLAPRAFARCEVGRRELARTDIERSLAIWPHYANGAYM